VHQSRRAGLVPRRLARQRRMDLSQLPLLEDGEIFWIRHGRVTSLASALLRMIWVWLKGHTLCALLAPST